MEKKRSVINELSQGKKLAEQLSKHLINPSPHHDPDVLLAKILSCYDKAISVLSSTVTADLSGHIHKKRKTMPRRAHQVRAPVCSSADDGYSWRKYGQKDILGALFPRAYYRCTHRNSQGCLATKQVQRSNYDPTLYELSYGGRHTCVQSSRLATANERQLDNPKREPLDQIKVETTQLLSDSLEDDILSSFSFPCDLVGLDDIFAVDDGWMGGYSSATSDLTVSAGTSASNSPVGDLNFSFDNLEFFSFNFQSQP